MHEVGAAGRAIATRAANLLVVAFKRSRQPGVDDRANIGLVDAHAKGDGGHHNFKFARLECCLYALTSFVVEAGVISRGGHQPRQVSCELFRLLAGGGIDNCGTALGAGQQAANGGRPLRHRQLDHLNGQVIAPESVDELCRPIISNCARMSAWTEGVAVAVSASTGGAATLAGTGRACGSRAESRGPIARCSVPRRWR